MNKKLLKIKYNELITQVHGFFSVPVDHLTAIGVLADHFRAGDLTDSVVVSPDLGNAKTATQFARLLGLPVAAGSKQRLADDRVIIDSIVGDVTGKRAIVLDDEIATGGSIVELLERLDSLGCTGADVACTHGLFAGKAVEHAYLGVTVGDSQSGRGAEVGTVRAGCTPCSRPRCAAST